MEFRRYFTEPQFRRLAVATLLGFSALSVLLGMRMVIAFDQTAGATGATPVHWPSSSALRRSGDRPQLVVFAHPFCSCTAATINELETIPVKRKKGVQAPAITILFSRIQGDSDSQAPALWEKARSLGARVLWDDGGREAKRFGARTSGYTLLYSAKGELLFRGGVTGSRGHEGDNRGLDGLIASLDRAPKSGPATSLVFGCALEPRQEGMGR